MALPKTMRRIMTSSGQSCKKADINVAKTRIKVIGLLNWLRNNTAGVICRRVFSIFGPFTSRRVSASCCESPRGELRRSRHKSSGLFAQYFSLLGGDNWRTVTLFFTGETLLQSLTLNPNLILPGTPFHPSAERNSSRYLTSAVTFYCAISSSRTGTNSSGKWVCVAIFGVTLPDQKASMAVLLWVPKTIISA